MRNTLVTASLLAFIVAVAPACATKKFVRTEVGNVNSKVDTLGKTVEETQERTRQNETRIGTVDTKAEAAARAAADARTAAGQAQAAADAAAASTRTVDTRVTTVAASVAGVSADVAAAGAAARKLIYSVTLSEDQGNFTFGKTDLPEGAKMALDQMVDKLKANPNSIWIEVEGHTDNIGTQEINEKIGLERAESVKRYLYMQHQVPLHKINVISYGKEKPVAPNNTKEGRAQNRRVVVRVLS